MKEIQPCELYVSGHTPVLTGRFWCMEEWSFAKSSLPGIGRDKSWKVSTVVETCHTFRELISIIQNNSVREAHSTIFLLQEINA